LEEGQKTIEKRLEDNNKRIDDLRTEMNNLRSDLINRIDSLRSEMNNRFDDLRFWLGLIATAVFASLGGMFGLWLYLVRNLRQAAGGSNGRAVTAQRNAELEEMQKRIAVLETQLKQMQTGPA
jgi:cell division protein FtsB